MSEQLSKEASWDEEKNWGKEMVKNLTCFLIHVSREIRLR